MQNSYRPLLQNICFRLFQNKIVNHPQIIAFYKTQSTSNSFQFHSSNNGLHNQCKKNSIEGKVAIVTGGAQGIGFDIARTLLFNGLKGVTIADIDRRNGETSTKCLNDEFGKDKAMFVNCDVMNAEYMDSAFKCTLKQFNQLDIIINNAGIFDDKKWDQEIAVNIGGCVIGSLLGLQYMSKNCCGSGGIVLNIANTFAILPMGGCPMYNMTQAGIVTLSRALGSGCQYHRTGVKVMALCAGPANTKMMKDIKCKAINEYFGNELTNELKSFQIQEICCVSNAVLKMLNNAESGSIWIAQNSEEPFQIEFPRTIAELKCKQESKIEKPKAEIVRQKENLKKYNDIETCPIVQKDLPKSVPLFKTTTTTINKAQDESEKITKVPWYKCNCTVNSVLTKITALKNSSSYPEVHFSSSSKEPLQLRKSSSQLSSESKVYDAAKGLCHNQNVPRLAEDKSFNLYESKPVEKILPVHLNRNTMHEWEKHKLPLGNVTDDKYEGAMFSGFTKPTKQETKENKSSNADLKTIAKTTMGKNSDKSKKKPPKTPDSGASSSANIKSVHSGDTDSSSSSSFCPLKVSKSVEPDTDNSDIEWHCSIYECPQKSEEGCKSPVQQEECIETDIDKKCTEDLSLKPMSCMEKCLNETSQCLSVKCAPKEKTMMQTRCQKGETFVEGCPPKLKAHTKKKTIPEAEEYQKMCEGMKRAWARCPDFKVDIPYDHTSSKPHREVSDGMRKAWARCTPTSVDIHNSDNPAGCEQHIQEQVKHACNTLQEDQSATKNLSDVYNQIDNFNSASKDGEICQSVIKAWSQCNKDLEDIKKLVDERCPKKFEEKGLVGQRVGTDFKTCTRHDEETKDLLNTAEELTKCINKVLKIISKK